MAPRSTPVAASQAPDIFQRFKDLCAQRGLTAEQATLVVREMVKGAMERKFGKGVNFELTFEPAKRVMRLVRVQRVVGVVTDPMTEVSLTAAQQEDPEFAVGDDLETDLDPQTMGRYASFAGKDAMRRQTRVFLHDEALARWKDKVGTLVVVTVSRLERGTAWCVIQGESMIEAVLPQREQSRVRAPKEGDTMEVAITEVTDSRDVIRLVVSEGGAGYVQAVLQSRTADEVWSRIEIVKSAREAGVVTKFIVRSKDAEGDAVRAVVGKQGQVLQKVAQDVGERIDVIPWTDDEEELIARCLGPADITEIVFNDDKTVTAYVHDASARRIAVGDKGANVRLASRLTGRDISIQAEVGDARPAGRRPNGKGPRHRDDGEE